MDNSGCIVDIVVAVDETNDRGETGKLLACQNDLMQFVQIGRDKPWLEK